MRLEDLANRLPEEWREDFMRLAETGEASEAFCRFLDEDAACQDAVEEAVKVQGAEFERYVAQSRKKFGHGPYSFNTN